MTADAESLAVRRLIDCAVVELPAPAPELTGHWSVVTDAEELAAEHFRSERPDDGRGCAARIVHTEASG